MDISNLGRIYSSFYSTLSFNISFSNNHFLILGIHLLNFGNNSSYLLNTLSIFASRSMMIEIKKCYKMNNSLVNMSFVVAKIATAKDKRAKMLVNGISLTYNVSQIVRLNRQATELSELHNLIVCAILKRGYYTNEELHTMKECSKQIEEYSRQIAQHQFMSVIDCISLFVAGINNE